MDKRNDVLKYLLNRLTLLFIEDRVVESTMVDEQEEIKHQDMILPINKESPSFEARDPLEEVNLVTDDMPRTTKVSGLLAKIDKC